MRSFLTALTTAMLLFITAAVQAGPVSVDTQPPSALLVQVHADWCGSCKVLDPRVQAMSETLQTNNVLVVKLDFTDAESSKSASLMAAALGISAPVSAHNGTGTLLAFEPDVAAAPVVLSRSNSDAEILAAVGIKAES